MASKNTISNSVTLINQNLPEDVEINVSKDAAGYFMHEMRFGQCERTLKYGLRAREMQAVLDGMLLMDRL